MSRPPLSSTPILRAALAWGGVVGAGVIIIAAVVGGLSAGVLGAWSGVLGALVGSVFPALTAVSILIGNRWYGTPNYLQVFFGIVMGGWILKFVLVIVLLLILLQMDWLVRGAFFLGLVLAAVLSLVVDFVVFTRHRMPAVSEVELPTRNPEE